MNIMKLTLLLITVWIMRPSYSMDEALAKLDSLTGADLVGVYDTIKNELSRGCSPAQLQTLAEKLGEGEAAGGYDLEDAQECANFVRLLMTLVDRKKGEYTVASSSSSAALVSKDDDELIKRTHAGIAALANRYSALTRKNLLLQTNCAKAQEGWTAESHRARSYRDERDAYCAAQGEDKRNIERLENALKAALAEYGKMMQKASKKE